MGKYTFKAYSKIFPELFLNEKVRILSSITTTLTIEHVGSTSIPLLGGKGIIDIAISTYKKNFDIISLELQKLGYTFKPTRSTIDRLFFRADLPDLEETLRRYHIHLTHPESDDWKDFISFRDYLCTHPQEIENYAKIKKEAALEANQNGEKYRKMKEPIFQKIKSLLNTNNSSTVSVYIATSTDDHIAREDETLN